MLIFAHLQTDWFFNEDDSSSLQLPTPQIDEYANEADIAINQALLRDNINKIEGNPHKDKLLYNILSAAQRKVKKKTGKSGSISQDSKCEPISPTATKEFADQLNQCDSKQVGLLNCLHSAYFTIIILGKH